MLAVEVLVRAELCAQSSTCHASRFWHGLARRMRVVEEEGEVGQEKVCQVAARLVTQIGHNVLARPSSAIYTRHSGLPK